MLVLVNKNDLKQEFIIIEIEFFGVLRSFTDSSLFFQLFQGITVSKLREVLFFFLKKNNTSLNIDLLNLSVFSNYSEVLSDNFILNFSQKLFVLPPAAGG